jgi:hypothetical protein
VITQIPEFIAEDSSNFQGAAMSGEARLLAVAAPSFDELNELTKEEGRKG